VPGRFCFENEEVKSMSASKTDALQEALALVVRDIPVFPCSPLDKRPLVPRGFYDASRDPALVRWWWEKRWPEALLLCRPGSGSS
jgi:Bifunctional DNA primase/polymerase, N-terminal